MSGGKRYRTLILGKCSGPRNADVKFNFINDSSGLIFLGPNQDAQLIKSKLGHNIRELSLHYTLRVLNLDHHFISLTYAKLLQTHEAVFVQLHSYRKIEISTR